MSPEENRTVRAGEYVLGLMDEDERLRAEREIETEPEFAKEVAVIAERFASLDATAEPESVPDALWAAIASRIEDRQGREPSPIAADRAPMRRQEPAATRARRSSGWRNLAMAASLLVAFGLGYAGGHFMSPASAPVVVVVLVDEQNLPGAIMEAYGDDSVRVVPLREFEVPDGKVLEAWTLFDEDVGPVSLGTFEAPREITLTGPDLPRPQPDQLYEITLEDAPGSPVGRPLGPILVKGLAVAPPR